ncbi:unnamed protein product [Tilletia controversa]|uniref:Uncharacterized protein n=1 Tax=Tilletia caries TaxID=13290 RepID=A0ABN7J5B9_9BASI|nr:unnamed protein product [Tilletia controversa]CAD6949142.1 unnamed protein product [Tilletia caries]CAD6954349.1 unnamed protein product [Tilletia caries]CAD6978836.1 unnamed protein product [Tilletia controversa]
MTSLPTPSTSGDDHNPKPFKRDRKSDDITAGGGSADCSKVNAIIGIDADVEAEVNFIKKLYLVLYVKSRICLAINLPVSLWGFNITAPLGPSPPHLQDQSHPR